MAKRAWEKRFAQKGLAKCRLGEEALRGSQAGVSAPEPQTGDRMRYLVGTNIKMYLTGLEALDWIRGMERDVPQTELVDVALFPTFPALVRGPSLVTKKNIGLGAQNMAHVEKGAFTGEVSVLSLKELGLTYAELGHHERRLHFNETDEMVRQKIGLALAHGLRALVCVGEDESQRENAESFAYGQVGFLTEGLALSDPESLIIAYEPRWAIGVDKPAPPEHARDCCRAARKALVEKFGPRGSEVRIIYGGSVRSGDMEAILALPDVNGLFIGRAALSTSTFARAVNLARDQAAADLEAMNMGGKAVRDIG